GAEDEQPRGDEAPGNEGFPECVEESGPRESCVEICAASRKLPSERQCRPCDAGCDDPWPGLFAGELGEPVARFGSDAHGEKEDIHCPIAIQACSDGKDLPES